ncbi:bactericidal permeability-increasing protein-like isoform X2 [Dromiciops gliroides]|uniref:bactericidal permeability-increasing protein-like isoform X2 n=1 Tax=Dromiciops gliroides TaxID=33562 RepID=UPI001CC5059F|nr:bactericidal permeability-increasing protein-like isoform X2 [Dromiciops gliroides]
MQGILDSRAGARVCAIRRARGSFKMLWFLVVLLGAGTEAVTPGIKAKMTLKGLDYGKQVGAEFLKSALLRLPIPDFKGSRAVPVVGHVKYTVTGLQVDTINLGESLVAFAPSSRLKLSMGPAEAQLNGHWSVKASLIHDSGTLKLSVGDMMLAVLVEVGWDGAGRLVVSPAGCSCHIGHFGVTFHGGSSWLFKIFAGALEDSIRRELGSKLCEEIGNAVGALERVLQTIPESSHISPIADLNYSLVAAPLITNQSIELDLKGEFYTQAGRKETPVPPTPFSLWEQNDFMLLLGVSDFVANSAALVYYEAEALSWNLTQSKIPKTFPIHLNTESFKGFVPVLQKQFPDTPMALKIFARLPPSLQTQPGTLQFLLPGAVQAFVLPNGTSAVPVFLLHADTKASAQVFTSGKKIGASLKLTNFSLTLAHSDVGPFPVDKLETLLNIALKSAIVPRINRKLKEGFPLPTLHKTSFQDTLISIQKGFLVIATDVQYGA